MHEEGRRQRWIGRLFWHRVRLCCLGGGLPALAALALYSEGPWIPALAMFVVGSVLAYAMDALAWSMMRGMATYACALTLVPLVLNEVSRGTGLAIGFPIWSCTIVVTGGWIGLLVDTRQDVDS